MMKAKAIVGLFSVLSLPFQNNLVNSEIGNPNGFSENDIGGGKRIFVSSDPRDVHFYSFADRTQPETYSEIHLGSKHSLYNSGLVPNERVTIIIHGFISGVSPNDIGPCSQLKNAYLANNFRNIICVDWYKLANPTLPSPLNLYDYLEGISNVKIVGTTIAKFIEFLVESGYIEGPHIVHLLGHSLGGHVAGDAGMRTFRRLGRKVRRITGLDPAGPIYFPFLSLKLDKSDATFVDVIHTNVNLLGSAESSGHADFFVNGGISTEQPGCERESSISTLTGGFPCSHIISYTYYARTINGEKLIGCKCTKNRIEHFKAQCSASFDGTCQDPTLLGEYGPETAIGDYYVTVTS